MVLFRIFWIVDFITALISVYFFFIGLADGTVSAKNMGLWMLILAGLAAILIGSSWLKTHQYPSMAMASVLILAIPALLSLVFILIMIFGKVKWN